MTAYAPLFAKTGATQWTPDLIFFDNTRVMLTPSYHLQSMFARHRPDHGGFLHGIGVLPDAIHEGVRYTPGSQPEIWPQKAQEAQESQILEREICVFCAFCGHFHHARHKGGAFT